MQIDLSWEALLSLGTVSSLIDIVIVSFIIYQLIKIVRGTRINELLNGIFIVLTVKVISSVFNLHTTEYLIDFVIQWSALALIIIFQPELRRGLEHLGRGSVFAKKKKADPADEMIDALKKSITYMSKRRIGALISIEMETGLDEYVGTGIRMNSEISSELVTNIFIPNTPLHDGAVIIQNFKISSAASYLPLSESSAIPKEFGTRHRAAIGLSEVSDAITLIVSEETGNISLSHLGNLKNDLTIDELVAYLEQELIVDEDEATGVTDRLYQWVMKGVRGE
ncbi:diadenylate cyclase CdaA [Dolosigranulum pigrum]|uniref:diadenylate cyclase CdaA n=1 Tax=Dolosigranulum pigrum TaxID=29394 RepID=UPI001AD85775|nr:diadenylate cyclase CdaA [Dolosigranulum pigrum]QTJ43771.1 TIGR00159 family protein [Dolosigranulum pigrum]QTJ47192.1 TIGR00159 family protein [Dolosigranulum pigrum]QTJ60703.1 TIGR00159 family protein [Dolosigranulum pigrum]